MLRNKYFWARCGVMAGIGAGLNAACGLTWRDPALYIALVGGSAYGLISYYEGRRDGLMQGARWIARRWVNL